MVDKRLQIVFDQKRLKMCLKLFVGENNYDLCH